MGKLSDLLFSEDAGEGGEQVFAEVILPLPMPQLYTYSVPLHLREFVKRGVRVEVPFQKTKLYAGIVSQISLSAPQDYSIRPILSVLDEKAIVTDEQIRLWQWLADYYLCTLGEVMQAALPAGFKLSSETHICLHHSYEDAEEYLRTLNIREQMLMEQLVKRGELSIDEVKKLLNLSSVQPMLKLLIDKRLISIKEELEEKYRPKFVNMVQLHADYLEESALAAAFEELRRSAKQTQALMALLQLTREKEVISAKELYERGDCDSVVVGKLVEKGIAERYQMPISRLAAYEYEGIGNYKLSDMQQLALASIEEQFKTKKTILLHGVTGSGKTQVFVELIEQTIAKGQQVLYLLPEIALTAQIVGRLQKHFGDKIVVYHSKFSSHERVEIWQRALTGTPILLGARSALFLPFKNLGLIIVDEEHDPSYKQADPAPRYNARDTAVYMSNALYPQCRTLLGTATPSVESYFNVLQGRYGLVEMKNRHGGLAMPEMFLVDLAEEQKQKRMKSSFSETLLQALRDCLDRGEQAILFQNRRGYAPLYKCQVCGWAAECRRCDVSMTYHKHSNDLHCHYCGDEQRLPNNCPACGSVNLGIQGFGTERIEDELQLYIEQAKTVRMDLDTVRGKDGAQHIIEQFEKKEVNVLVGTQMVTKGLDFDNVGLVGVLNADLMLQFPDFRASERAYQLLTQVAGRAGRKHKRGRVLVQARQIKHPVLHEIQRDDFEGFLRRELAERELHGYPPFTRLIKIQLRDKHDLSVVNAAKYFAERMRLVLPQDCVLGPAEPGISKIREYYMLDIMIKLPRNQSLINRAKQAIMDTQGELKRITQYAKVRVYVDVDPY